MHSAVFVCDEASRTISILDHTPAATAPQRSLETEGRASDDLRPFFQGLPSLRFYDHHMPRTRLSHCLCTLPYLASRLIPHPTPDPTPHHSLCLLSRMPHGSHGFTLSHASIRPLSYTHL